MKITIYQNKRNKDKYIEVHNDGYYHNSVRQFMLWKYKQKRILLSTTKNFVGDGRLHRWSACSLKELLEDYKMVKEKRL